VNPIRPQRPSWLPVNLAARAISEIVLSPSPIDSAPKVYHVLNPHISSWSTILKGLHQGGLEFDEVDRRVWLDRLRDSEPDVEKNPTFKLLVSGFVSHFIAWTVQFPFGRLPLETASLKESSIYPNSCLVVL
jgi:hypothetical protein